MYKTAILLLSLLTTAPVQAEDKPFTRAVTTPASVRYGRVYEFAKHICPTAVDGMTDHESTLRMIEVLNHASHEAMMTEDERATLLLMCDMYNRGVRQTHMLPGE